MVWLELELVIKIIGLYSKYCFGFIFIEFIICKSFIKKILIYDISNRMKFILYECERVQIFFKKF